jgi:pyridoxine/pyridoxamine 5'-phosphate oxidase
MVPVEAKAILVAWPEHRQTERQGAARRRGNTSMSLSDFTKLTASMGFTDRNDPFALFGEWLKEAEASEPNDANAMALATVDEEGLPNVRMVLLRTSTRRVSCSTPITKARRGRKFSEH